MEDKAVLESYKDTIRTRKGIPSVTAIRNTVLDNICRKAYDLVYGLEPEMVRDEDIAKVLMKHNCIFSYEGEVFNRVQTSLFANKGG